jgi:hypothetical protein
LDEAPQLMRQRVFRLGSVRNAPNRELKNTLAWVPAALDNRAQPIFERDSGNGGGLRVLRILPQTVKDMQHGAGHFTKFVTAE